MDEETPVTASAVVNLIVAAHQLFRDFHHTMGEALLVRAENLAPRIADPIQYLSVVNQLDKLWRQYHIAGGLRPAGVREAEWLQLDLPFGKGEN